MKISVVIERERKKLEIDLPKNSTIKSLLEKLNINPVNALVSVNNEICTEQEILNEKDRVEIFSVVSGG